MSAAAQQDLTSSLQRALALLDAFSAERPELSIRELSERSGVARSTTHRLAQELIAWGALERTSGGLRLGAKLRQLGGGVPSHDGVRDTALPHLHRLREATGLTSGLAVLDGREVVRLETVTTIGQAVPHIRLGGRVALHATALGKVMLAFSDRVELDVLAATMRPLTPRTITSAAGLRAELHRVRAEGVALDVEESRIGRFCVAAPILDRQRRAIGAISVTGPTGSARAQRYVPAVLASASAIARELFPAARATA